MGSMFSSIIKPFGSRSKYAVCAEYAVNTEDELLEKLKDEYSLESSELLKMVVHRLVDVAAPFEIGEFV